MIDHVTPEQADDFRRARLTDPERRHVAGHLASCASCSSRVAADRSVALAAASLEDDFTAVEHPEIDELFAYVDGNLNAGRTAAIATHLHDCARCSEDVDDASRERESLRPRRSTGWLAAAAAAVVALALGTWWVVRTQPNPTRPMVHTPLPAAIAMPAVLTDLRSHRETLRGSAASDRSPGMHPSGIVVVTDRPAFSWNGVPDRTYVVTVMCNDAIAAVSDPVRGASWTPARPLPRGTKCVWQVELLPEHTILPQPPDPQPAFRVLDAATLAAIQKNGGGDFATGVLYARAGAQQEAIEHFNRWIVTHPADAAARAALESVRRW